MTETTERIRDYWHTDAATYDDSASHHPRTALERAAWSAALRRLLPPPPARVLDVGAGTGFISLLLARQGYEVTALDLAEGMLDRLRAKAADEGLRIQTVRSDAAHPPAGEFDAVTERHLVWTLPDPATALAAWRTAAPRGRLVLLESIWGAAATDPAERLRVQGRAILQRVLRRPDDHHAEYDPHLRSQLPLGGGTVPDRLAALVESTPWGAPRIERLRDVEWATREALPTAADRLLGTHPRFAVTAG